MSTTLRIKIRNIIAETREEDLEEAIHKLLISELDAMKQRCAPRSGICLKKKRYATQADAEDALRHTRAEYPNDAGWLRAYHCDGCMGYHVGKRFSGLRSR